MPRDYRNGIAFSIPVRYRRAGTDPDPERTPMRKRLGTLPILLLAAPAFVSVWSGWVGLGKMTGFGEVQPLPGIWDSLTIDSAITLPIGVEAYAALAMRAWLGRPEGAPGRTFAKRSALGSLILGALGQIAYHVLKAQDVTKAPWPLVAFVATLPVVVVGFGAALHQVTHRAADPEVT